MQEVWTPWWRVLVVALVLLWIGWTVMCVVMTRWRERFRMDYIVVPWVGATMIVVCNGQGAWAIPEKHPTFIKTRQHLFAHLENDDDVLCGPSPELVRARTMLIECTPPSDAIVLPKELWPSSIRAYLYINRQCKYEI